MKFAKVFFFFSGFKFVSVHTKNTKDSKFLPKLSDFPMYVAISGHNLSCVASEFAMQNLGFTIHCCICIAKDV